LKNKAQNGSQQNLALWKIQWFCNSSIKYKHNTNVHTTVIVSCQDKSADVISLLQVPGILVEEMQPMWQVLTS
jgi:hypothetical protein